MAMNKIRLVRKAVLSSLLVCTLLPAAAEVPFCALRFGAVFTQPDKWPEMRAALEKNRTAFDEVWFSTGVSFPPLAWHAEHARQCAKAADDLRKLGIIPSIELQTIIGHTGPLCHRRELQRRWQADERLGNLRSPHDLARPHRRRADAELVC